MTTIANTSEAGFSRLGTLVALAVLGLAATLAQPFLAQAMAGTDATRASDEIVEVLGEARRLAIGRARPVPVVVDEHNRSVSVEGGSWRKLPAGTALAGPAPDRDGRAMLVFNPDGSSSGGQVVVSARGSAVSLLLDADSGRVRRMISAPCRAGCR